MGKNTTYNHFDNVRNSTYSLYRSVEFGKLSFEEYLQLKKKRVFDHPSYKKLTRTYEAHISGMSEALYGKICEKTEWLHSYVNRAGRTVFVKKWEKMPLYIRRDGKFKSGFYWKDTTKPWGKISDGNKAPGLGLKPRKKPRKKIKL